MQAMVMREFGAPEVLSLTEVPMPVPGPGEVLIRVRTSAVARTRDVGVRGGRGPVFPRLVKTPHVLGGEHAGLVEAVGPGVDEGLVGRSVAVSAPIPCGQCAACADDRPWDCPALTVIGIHHWGSNAEFTVAPAANIELLPKQLDFVQAAVLAGNGPLADAELKAAGTASGDWVLVPGASGAVGSIAVGIAARLGAHVIGLTRTADATAPLEALGAEIVLDTGLEDLGERLLSYTGGHGIDVVIDNLTLIDLWQRYWPALARGGRVVVSGRVGDLDPLPVDVIGMYQRRLSLMGIALGDPREVTSFWDDMRRAPLILPDELVHAFPLEQAAKAHALIEEGGKLGHFVLTVD